MTQTDLNRAVARATGETVSQIARLGFSLIVVPNGPDRAGSAQVRRRGTPGSRQISRTKTVFRVPQPA